MDEKHVDICLQNGGTLRIEPVTDHIFRIRLRPDSRFREAAMIRYGILRNEWPQVPFQCSEDDDTVIVRTNGAVVSVGRRDGRIRFSDGRGILLQETEKAISADASGFAAEFALADDEKLYGLGDESRHLLQKRGHRAKMWVKNVDCYAPVPFLYSNKGWGLFLNTTWRHFFDLGQQKPNRWKMFAKRGELDYYLIAGADYAHLLDRFTDITGKPELLPLWAYGLTFVCNQQADAREVLDDAMHFRREGIPCDMIGLEPGWMQTHYDYSVDKKWHPDRFFIPGWAREGPQTFIGALERLGFKLSLWLCSDYDITYHEEQRAGHNGSAAAPDESVSGDYNPDDFEQDLRAHAPVYMDRLTKREEPWFRHLTPFVDQGVKAFKMDGARQVNEHPDRRWGNGMDDEELHNAYPVLLNKQMHEGFREHTNLRPMIYTSGGYAGIQRYAATWAGDTGGGPKPLISMLNHGMVGHANASCDMDVFTPDGIHFGFLQPWSQVNSWAYWRHPWLLGDKLLPMFKFYAKLRYRLLPYLYSAAHVAARTGMPIIRSMPLAYPDDPRSDELVQQYMLGDSLLVAAFSRDIHLPEGTWIDYWSGQRYLGPADMAACVPEDRGGPLFVKAGAIIPAWPEIEYVGQKPLDTIDLHFYPHGSSEFVLYEDDGLTFGYKSGETALTRITCAVDGTEIRIGIGAREGRYEGMPERRSYDLRIHTDREPTELWVGGGKLRPEEDWWYRDGSIGLRAEEETGGLDIRCRLRV